MKPSTELFQLIKSLSKSEKRYFKLTSSLQSGEKNYMKLFDAIEEQTEYDEDAIKNKFKTETFIKHLPSEKNHLYNLILKSLRGFYADNSAASILQEQLRNIELLYNKALYKECTKYIKKAKSIAYQYEKFYFLLDLIDWEKKLIEESYSRGVFNSNLTELVKEEGECIEKLNNLAEYQKLYSKINYAIRNKGFTRTVEEEEIIEEITNHPLIKGKKTALSTKAATACYSIKGMCASTNGNFEETNNNFKKVIKIMEDNPSIMKELPKRYIKALNSLMYYNLDTNDYDTCFETINKIKSLKTATGFESIDSQLSLFTLPYNAELITNLNLGNYDTAVNDVLPKILDGIELYQGKLSIEDEILFYYNISRAYFGNEDYKNALKYINKVLNSNENMLRQDIFTFAQLINLIIHYELGNIDLLEYTIKSVKRFITKKETDHQFETVFLKNMSKLIKVKNPDDLTKTIENFRKELNKVTQDPYQKVALKYFDFIAWLDTKLLKKTYSELIQGKNHLVS
ncbi:hypothetical protein FRY74_08060 [Vicingus serpentipes]|uniref:Uncharacterized protein n=1 Tax=Vicingus serpentipes TaxID=1926625 RepID=A0A5C6RT91_9FLAO|nr:hypothetical protein [Vicingus serpentipes]TXB65367.1 hypothetical protein FRY74_08060 [Vicingus serpentipes]